MIRMIPETCPIIITKKYISIDKLKGNNQTYSRKDWSIVYGTRSPLGYAIEILDKEDGGKD